jgi:hypothetical protein
MNNFFRFPIVFEAIDSLQQEPTKVSDFSLSLEQFKRQEKVKQKMNVLELSEQEYVLVLDCVC